MKSKSNCNKKRNNRISASISFIMFLLFVILFAMIEPFNDWSFVPNAELFGQYGDFIGGLFGTMVALIAAILLYQTLISQKNTLQQQKDSFEIERFETTFFNLLKTQREITNEIVAYFPFLHDSINLKWQSGNGLAFFEKSKKELLKIWESLENKKYLDYFYENDIQGINHKIEELHLPSIEPSRYFVDPDEKTREIIHEENLKLCNRYYKLSQAKWEKSKKGNVLIKTELMYYAFFEKFHYLIGHYFRHLYHILKLVASNESLKDKQKYIGFMQAQMSSFELMLLFYNSS